jgi:hypothetical protein
VRYELKTPYDDGTTHVLFEPLDFMYRMYGMPWAQGCAGTAIARLAALVPKPRVNLTRYHGVLAPNSKYRARVTPARRGKGKKVSAGDENAAAMCASSPASDYTDVGGRAMPGAIAEKTRW